VASLCGVDIVEIDRIKKAFERNGKAFRDRIFTPREIEYCESRRAAKYQSYSARFAAKEAFLKALGTGISRGMNLKDVEILNDSNNKPYILLSGKAKEQFNDIKGKNISMSLSHCKCHAVAIVIIEN